MGCLMPGCWGGIPCCGAIIAPSGPTAELPMPPMGAWPGRGRLRWYFICWARFSSREISSSGWINLLVALVVVRVAGLLVMEGDGLAAVLLVVLVVDMVD